MALALHPRVRALTRGERLAVLAVALLVFLFAEGPVWRHRWQPDASILWSYAVIPVVVFAAFLRRGTPRLVPVVAESVLLAIVKFGITAFTLVALWSFGTPPAAARPGRLLEDLLRPKRRLPSSEGEQAGEGSPDPAAAERRAAALAARLAAAQAVTVGNGGFSSKVISLAPGKDVAFRSADGRLHTLELLLADGTIGRNVPLLASGAPRLMTFEEISLFSFLRCAVHPEERADLSASPGR